MAFGGALITAAIVAGHPRHEGLGVIADVVEEIGSPLAAQCRGQSAVVRDSYAAISQNAIVEPFRRLPHRYIVPFISLGPLCSVAVLARRAGRYVRGTSEGRGRSVLCH